MSESKICQGSEGTSSFPEDWPSCCPPPDAIDAQGTFFRVVRKRPCVADDFRSQAELGKFKGANQCLRHGLSVLCCIEAARNTCAKYPHLGKLISIASLAPEHGKVSCKNANGHATWWSYRDIVRHQLFSVIGDAP